MPYRIKKYLSVLLSLFVILSLFSVPVYAASDDVKITLETSTDGREYYLPGESTGYNLVLKNERGESWIRVKIQTSEEGFHADFSVDNLDFTDGWVLRGEYYYYTEKVEASSDVLIITGMTIPDTTEAENGATLTITADADAVQYSAVDPDFSLEEPWKDAKVASHTSSTSSSRNVSSGGGSSSSGNSSSTQVTEINQPTVIPSENQTINEPVGNEPVNNITSDIQTDKTNPPQGTADAGNPSNGSVSFGQTGDTKTGYIAFAALIISGMVMFITAKRKREEKNVKR